MLVKVATFQRDENSNKKCCKVTQTTFTIAAFSAFVLMRLFCRCCQDVQSNGRGNCA